MDIAIVDDYSTEVVMLRNTTELEFYVLPIEITKAQSNRSSNERRGGIKKRLEVALHLPGDARSAELNCLPKSDCISRNRTKQGVL